MSKIDDATLLKLAEAEILGETKKAILRQAVVGPSGWKPIPKTNKSFLFNTLLHTLSSNRVLSKKHNKEEKSMKVGRKLLQIDRSVDQRSNNNFVFKKSVLKKKVDQRSQKYKVKKKNKKKTGKCEIKEKKKS